MNENHNYSFETEAKPKVAEWLLIPLGAIIVAIFGTGFIAAFLIKIFELIGYETRNYAINRLLITILFFTMCIVFLYLQIQEHRFKNYWKLTEKSLIRGRPQNLEIRLEDISEIRIGLWYPRYWRVLRQFMRSEQGYDIELLYDTALIIRTESGLMLLLQLIRLNGGAQIMNNLVRLKKNCINKQLFYSEKEMRFLKLRNANKVLKR